MTKKLLSGNLLKKHMKDVVAASILIVFLVAGTPTSDFIKEQMIQTPGLIVSTLIILAIFYLFHPGVGILAITTLVFMLSNANKNHSPHDVMAMEGEAKVLDDDNGNSLLEGMVDEPINQQLGSGVTLEEEVIKTMAPIPEQGSVQLPEDNSDAITEDVSPVLDSSIPGSADF